MAVPEQVRKEADMAMRTQVSHWGRTRLLAIAVLFIWTLIALVLPFVALLSIGSQFDGAGAYTFVSEGMLILMLALVIWFTRRQRGIDGRFAMVEED
ncbi:MAG: hypothetical protein ACC634_02210 [Hyphomicrobiales bacterium]